MTFEKWEIGMAFMFAKQKNKNYNTYQLTNKHCNYIPSFIKN